MLIKKIFSLIIVSIVSLITSNALAIEIQKDNDSMPDELNYYQIKSYYEKTLPKDEYGNIIGNKWIQRWLWNNRNNIYPDGRFWEYPKDVLDTKYNKTNKDKIQSQSGWLPVGPEQLPPSYAPRSCHSMGRINCVAFHPTDPDVFWIGTPGGGIWKTENAGQTWMPMDDQLPSLAVSDIAVDPANPDIIYVTTGDIDATGGVSSGTSIGIIKTTDGGSSWTLTNLSQDENFRNSAMRRVIINPDSTNELIAAGRRGIWKSPDAGETWEFIGSWLVSDIEIDPVNPLNVYAATGTLWGSYGGAGIIKSTDFGSTWDTLNTGIPLKTEVSRVDVAISPADPDYIYAVAVNNLEGWRNRFHSFYLSTDAGKTWEVMSDYQTSTNILGAYSGDSTDTWGQGTYDLALLADPKDKNKVYVGGINLWMSENAGKDWEIAGFWIYCFGKSIHADHHYAAYNPIDDNIYFCNDGGIYRTKSIEPGSSEWISEWVDKFTEDAKPDAPDFKFPTEWEDLSSGLAITEFYRIGLSKNNPGYVTGGSQDNSCFYNNSETWIQYIPNWDGMETLIDHNNPEIIYGVWQNGGLCKSIDGGKTVDMRLADTIKNSGENGVWVTPTLMDPVDANTIYMGFRNFWRSEDGGYNWEKVFDLDSMNKESLNTNSIWLARNSYSDPDYLCLHKTTRWYNDKENDTSYILPGELWITKDDCDTWTLAGDGLPTDSMNIAAIDYDYSNPEKMWVIISTSRSELSLYLTEDGGETWQNISKPLPPGTTIWALLHHPGSPDDILYIGTNHGVYYTDNTLDEWLPFDKNLPNTQVRDLEIDLISSELYAATYGRGVWKTSVTTGIKQNEDIDLSYTISPNPAKDFFELNLNVKENIVNQAVKISILDITGRSVYSEEIILTDNSLKKVFNLNLINAVYFVRVSAGNRKLVEKLIINR
ncbi:T9SS type A sorting domain-containing protein [Bacteroidota bacterium]